MLRKGKKEELDQRKGGKCQKETHTGADVIARVYGHASRSVKLHFEH